jgi:hypothetical protein
MAPWNIEWASTLAGGDVGHVYIVDASGRKITAIWGKTEEKEFTARLIAAAPDLYAALVGVIAVADRRTVEFDAARTALAKATKARGETP